MISLNRYIKERNKIENIREYYGRNMPHDILFNITCGDIKLSYIDENLMSHDKGKLQRQLDKRFKDKINRYEDLDDNNDYNIKSFYMYVDDIDDFLYDEEFKDMLLFFNYYLSDFDKEHNILYIEPEFPKKIDLKEYHYKAYHFTDNDTGDKILSSGLRCKQSTYREYSSRIFLYLCKTKPKLNSQEVIQFVEDNCNTKNVKEHGWCCFQVDLSNIDCNVYNDEAIEGDNIVFTYVNIPRKCLKKIYDSRE